MEFLNRLREKSAVQKTEKFFPAFEMIKREMESLKGKCNNTPSLNNSAEGKKYYTALLHTKTGMEITPDEGIKILQVVRPKKKIMFCMLYVLYSVLLK